MARPSPSVQGLSLLLPLAALAGLVHLHPDPDAKPVAASRPGLPSPSELSSASSAPRPIPSPPPTALTTGSPDNETRQTRAGRRKYFPDPAATPEKPQPRASEKADGAGADDPQAQAQAQTLTDFIDKTRTLSNHFLAWARNYSEAKTKIQREELLVEGLYRANLRHEVMTELMRRAPEEAVRRSLPLHVYQNLPEDIQARVESPFSTLAAILPSSQPSAESPPDDSIRRLRIQFPGEDTPIECVAFGQRRQLQPKEVCAVQGIRLDGLAVLREDVVQLLQTRDIPAAREMFPVANPDPCLCFASGQILEDRFTVGLAGGKLLYFSDELTLLKFNRKIGALDLLRDPRLSSRSLFLPGAISNADSGFDFAFARKAPRAAPLP